MIKLFASVNVKLGIIWKKLRLNLFFNRIKVFDNFLHLLALRTLLEHKANERQRNYAL